MRVTNQSVSNTYTNSDSQLELKSGEIYTGTVKEQLSENEAIVQIRGKEVNVKFEDKIPQSDRIVIKVTGSDGDTIIAKSLSSGTASLNESLDQSVSNLFKTVGGNISFDLEKAVKIVQSFQIQVDTKVISLLKTFLSNSLGTEQQKLDSIKALLTKKLDLNLNNLRAVHSALTENPLTDMLLKVIPNPQNILELLRQQQSNQQHNPMTFPKSEILEDLLTEKTNEHGMESNSRVQSIKNGDPLVHNNQIQSSQIVASSTNAISNSVDSDSFVHHKSAMTIENAQIQEINRYVKENLEEVIHLLQNIQEYQDNDYIQNFIHLPSKDFIVSKVTQKLAEITHQFKNLQREVVRNLDNLKLAIQQASGNIFPQIKTLLENTIDLIDKAILKSDIMLFTDMKTEKTMIQASSQLSEARRLLSKGNNSEAREIVEEVKTTLRNIDFRPVDVKVRHYISKSIFSSQPMTTEQKLNHQLEQLVIQQQNINSSAKAVFEVIRYLGLNYESEVAQSLALNHDQIKLEDAQQNLKAILLQLLKGEQDSVSHTRSNSEVQQLLHYLTGQQLLSKFDTGLNAQMVYFSLPVPIGNQIGKLQVFINAKQQGQKVDWENCSVYILIKTKKIGDTGILLSATERNLSITVKNDEIQSKGQIEPLFEKYKERLMEVGYHVKGIQVTKLTPNLPDVQQKAEHKPTTSTLNRLTTTSKGFDFKV